MQKKPLLVFVFIFTFFICVDGQEIKTVRDLGLWTEMTLEKKVTKTFTVRASQHLRFYKDISGFDDYIAEAGVKYKINKHFSIGANGRYTRNKKYDESIFNDYRYSFDFRYETKIYETVKIYYRLRYQKEFYDSGVFYDAVNYYETAFRHRIKTGWKFNENHRLYTSFELFRLTKKSREPFYSKYRIFTGDDFNTKIGNFDLSFGLEHELDSLNPYTYFLISFAYKIEL